MSLSGSSAPRGRSRSVPREALALAPTPAVVTTELAERSPGGAHLKPHRPRPLLRSQPLSRVTHPWSSDVRRPLHEPRHCTLQLVERQSAKRHPNKRVDFCHQDWVRLTVSAPILLYVIGDKHHAVVMPTLRLCQ